MVNLQNYNSSSEGRLSLLLLVLKGAGASTIVTAVGGGENVAARALTDSRGASLCAYWKGGGGGGLGWALDIK